jgi:2-methylcitrate dehydratase PrpD
VEGAAGEKQFSDRAVRDPAIVALRDRVATIVDPAVHEEQVRVAIVLKDGRRLEQYVEHAVGSLQRPMSDAALEAKFADLADGVLPKSQARKLMDLCWGVEKRPSAAELAKAATV